MRYVGPDPWPGAKQGKESPPDDDEYALSNWDAASSDSSDKSDWDDPQDVGDIPQDSDTEMVDVP